jgi:hypothetical protein
VWDEGAGSPFCNHGIVIFNPSGSCKASCRQLKRKVDDMPRRQNDRTNVVHLMEWQKDKLKTKTKWKERRGKMKRHYLGVKFFVLPEQVDAEFCQPDEVLQFFGRKYDLRFRSANHLL